MNLTFDLYELNTITILVRILLAVLIGGLIGMERGMKNHGQGYATYILVCLGSTMVMMTNQYVTENIGGRRPNSFRFPSNKWDWLFRSWNHSCYQSKSSERLNNCCWFMGGCLVLVLR